MSHCNLYSCNSNEYCQQQQQSATDGATTYSTTVSTDTLWDPKSEPAASSCNRQRDFKQQRPSSVYHQPNTSAHSYIHRYVHPSQVQPVQGGIPVAHAYVQSHFIAKPKSWDNLAANNCGKYAIGYVVNNPSKQPTQLPIKNQQMQQVRAPPLPRKIGHVPCGRYSAFSEVENYVPAPQQYVQEATITKTTIITTKSTENLISNAQFNMSDGSCECITQPSHKQSKSILAANCMECNAANTTGPYHTGYYSNLSRNTSNHCLIPTKTEITRLWVFTKLLQFFAPFDLTVIRNIQPMSCHRGG